MEMQRERLNQTNNRGNSNMPIIIALLAACIVVLGVMLTMILVMDNKKDAEVKAEPPVLVITECPSTVYANENSSTTLNMSGTMMDKNTSCELKINGQSIKTVASIGETVTWTASFNISAGATMDYRIELINANNISVSETRTVRCEAVTVPTSTPAPTAEGPLQLGCEFVKKKGGGLNIRQYAGTYYDVVDFINRDDYTSRMVFTGNIDVDYEGYTWYQVISPNGKYGYVRSDLVRRVS